MCIQSLACFYSKSVYIYLLSLEFYCKILIALTHIRVIKKLLFQFEVVLNYQTKLLSGTFEQVICSLFCHDKKQSCQQQNHRLIILFALKTLLFNLLLI